MNEQAIALSASIVKVIPTIEEFTHASVDRAREDFSRYTALGVITGGAFDDRTWHTTDEYANLSLDFSFPEFDYHKWYQRLFSVPYRDFVLYVKAFILQLLGRKILVSLQGIVNDLKRIIRTDPAQIYGLDTKLVVIHANACSDFFSHLPGSRDNEGIEQLLGALDELAFRQQVQGTARSLALFDTYFLFQDILHDEMLGLIVSHSGGMPGVDTWFERFLDADRTLVILINRDTEEYRVKAGFWNGLQLIARDREPEPIRTIEELTVKNPDKSKWESFCGKYEHPEDADFIVDEVFLKDGELHVKAIDEDGDEMSFRLYPIGENEFGRKGGMLKLSFGDGCLMFDDITCKKL